jgi:hypothetical protein
MEIIDKTNQQKDLTLKLKSDKIYGNIEAGEKRLKE